MQTAIQLFCRGKDLWIKWKKIGRIRVFPTFHKLFHRPKLKKALQTKVCKAFSGICDYYVKNWGILI